MSSSEPSTLRQPKTARSFSVPMDRVAAVVLAGGKGTRLQPLTLKRCKPALPFGGRYRLIDLPLSLSLNAGIRNVFILSQYESSTLQRHVNRSYPTSPTSSSSVLLLSPEETTRGRHWYEGTADAVAHHAEMLRSMPVDYILILSGDQIYTMDYRRLLDSATSTNADLVIASLPVNTTDATRMGILRMNESGRITEFVEKPEDPTPYATDERDLLRHGLFRPGERRFLASMGIYLFKKSVLLEALEKGAGVDFGKHIIPNVMETHTAQAFLFDGYWEDIGTLSAYHRANLSLTQESGPFRLDDCALYGEPLYLPGARIVDTQISNSIVEPGCSIYAKRVEGSIIGPRTVIGSGTEIADTYILGNDISGTAVQIGKDCRIVNAIIDRNVQIGDGVQLFYTGASRDCTKGPVIVRDGVVVVPANTVLPDGFSLVS